MQHRFATVFVLLGVALGAGAAPAQDLPLPPVSLPAPQTEGGKPLMQALRLRATARAFKDAPVTLVLVADTARMQGGPDTQAYAYADAAFVSQNVYLFCASEGRASSSSSPSPWASRESSGRRPRADGIRPC